MASKRRLSVCSRSDLADLILTSGCNTLARKSPPSWSPASSMLAKTQRRAVVISNPRALNSASA